MPFPYFINECERGLAEIVRKSDDRAAEEHKFQGAGTDKTKRSPVAPSPCGKRQHSLRCPRKTPQHPISPSLNQDQSPPVQHFAALPQKTRKRQQPILLQMISMVLFHSLNYHQSFILEPRASILLSLSALFLKVKALFPEMLFKFNIRTILVLLLRKFSPFLPGREGKSYTLGQSSHSFYSES